MCTRPVYIMPIKANQAQVYGTIFLSNTNRVLVVKGRRSGKWSFPKGHAEGNESDFEAASRETYEETGLLLPRTFNKIVHLSTGTYFLVETSEVVPNPRDCSEVTAAEWVSFEALAKMPVNIDINTFLREHSSSYTRRTQRLPRNYPLVYILP
jgi:bis(5'-nucleosidyl)-tetraphosphatase